jgi:hypothetical protein
MGQASGGTLEAIKAPDPPSSAAAELVMSARPPHVVTTQLTVKKEL